MNFMFNAMFIVVPILVACGFVFTFLMMFSPKLRGKFMAIQMKSMKYMMDESHDDLASMATMAGNMGIKVRKNIIDENEDVLRDRFNQYLDKIFEVQIRHGSENAYVILSELVSGIIHNELRIENNQNLIEQFLSVTNYISQFLAELSYHFNTVYVYICPGNHSRVMAHKEESLKGENIDHLAIPFLQAKLQNFKNIVFSTNEIEESICLMLEIMLL